MNVANLVMYTVSVVSLCISIGCILATKQATRELVASLKELSDQTKRMIRSKK